MLVARPGASGDRGLLQWRGNPDWSLVRYPPGSVPLGQELRAAALKLFPKIIAPPYSVRRSSGLLTRLWCRLYAKYTTNPMISHTMSRAQFTQPSLYIM
jgi:hypothetical protein